MQTQDHLLLGALWLQATLLGSAATMIAVIAVGAVGLGMLSGRIDLRRGLAVVVGCFMLFGAPVIAAALLGLAWQEPGASPPSPSLPTATAAASAPPASAYDPYAGASLPNNR